MKFFNHSARDATAQSAHGPGRGATPHDEESTTEVDPLPVPEVIEGNEDSDWALWEDSVAFQDSQMQSGFGDLTAPEIRESSSVKPVEEHDPFGAVRRRTP
jgi:hypothetical protein